MRSWLYNCCCNSWYQFGTTDTASAARSCSLGFYCWFYYCRYCFTLLCFFLCRFCFCCCCRASFCWFCYYYCYCFSFRCCFWFRSIDWFLCCYFSCSCCYNFFCTLRYYIWKHLHHHLGHIWLLITLNRFSCVKIAELAAAGGCQQPRRVSTVACDRRGVLVRLSYLMSVTPRAIVSNTLYQQHVSSHQAATLLSNLKFFHSLEVVDRVETQLQVGENSNFWRLFVSDPGNHLFLFLMS